MSAWLAVDVWVSRVDGLLLDPDHPRASLPDASKQWLQTMHTECLAQLAAHHQGRQALLAEPAVCAALEQVSHAVSKRPL